MTKELSIVIPAYLEGENLQLILPRLKSVLSGLSIPFEIIVVDTTSPMDHTPDLCQSNQARHIVREGGNTYGDAVRTGIKKAEGVYTIFMDADGSHTPEFIPELFKFRNDADVVVASRYVEGGDTDNPKILIFMSWVVNAVYSLALGLKCKDVSNSFKLYKSADLKTLHLNSSNFDVVEEILYKIKKQKKTLKIKELPFVFKKRMFGNTKRNLVAFMLSYGVTLIKLRFGK